MLPTKHIEVLKILVDRLSGKKINWAIVGSTNLALQGVDVVAKDIDILTDKEGAYKIENVLKEFVVEGVEYREKKGFRSYRGLLKINSVEVEIMGDLEFMYSKTTEISNKKMFDCSGVLVPVIPLEDEYEAYVKLGREEKAKKVKEKLEELQ